MFPNVYDFRGCIAVGYSMEIVPFVNRLATLRFGIGKKKVGIVVYILNQEILVKVFIGLAAGLDLEIKMFEDPKECLKWIFCLD